MRISHRDKKFEHVMGGTYTMKGGKTYPIIQYASYFTGGIHGAEATEQVKGDKLYVSGQLITANGGKLTWEDVFERAK